MNRNLLSLITVLFVTLSLISCKKEKEEEPTPKKLLTAHPWKLNKVLAFGQEVPEEYAGALEAFNNSTFVFKSDGTYTATDNTSGGTTSGTWALQENDTKLFIKSGEESYTFTIKELTANTLYLTTQFSLPDFPVPIEVELQLVAVK